MCASANRTCSYAVSFVFHQDLPALDLDDLPLVAASPTTYEIPPHILRPLTLLPDASPTELRGLHQFLSCTATTLVAMASETNPNWAYWNMALNSPSKALFYTLVAAGTAHAANWGVVVDPRSCSQYERMALSALESELVALGGLIRSRDTTDGQLSKAVNSILAVLQNLVLLATTVGEVHRWRRHLEGAASLIAQVTRVRAGKQPLVLDTFLIETLRYLDMQAALALNCGTSIAQSIPETGWDPSQILVDPSITGMHGFSRGYLAAASRIADLSHLLHSNPTTVTNSFPTPPASFPSPPPPIAPPTPIPFNTLVSLYGPTISGIRLSLEDTRARLDALERDQTFRDALLRRLALGNHAEKLDGHFRFAECCYYACQVYLARTLTTGELDGDARAAVYAGLETLGKVPWEGSAGNLLGWVLVILGSELASDPPARGIVRLRQKALSTLGHRNLVQCAELLEEVWRRQDLWKEGEDIVTWQGTMRDLGWDLLVA